MEKFNIPRYNDGRINRKEFYHNFTSNLPEVLKEISELDALELIAQSNKSNPELFKNYSKTDIPSEGSYESFKQQLDSIEKTSITKSNIL
jgi:hypothetical protein